MRHRKTLEFHPIPKPWESPNTSALPYTPVPSKLTLEDRFPEGNVPWSELLLSMASGDRDAWEHPLVPLLWIEVGGSEDKLEELGNRKVSANNLLFGLSKAYGKPPEEISVHAAAVEWLRNTLYDESVEMFRVLSEKLLKGAVGYPKIADSMAEIIRSRLDAPQPVVSMGTRVVEVSCRLCDHLRRTQETR